MIFRTVQNISIPAIGLGTFALRGKECTRIVTTALQGNYRHIDTATFYENETEVGEGIRNSGVSREEIFLTTKVWWNQLSANGVKTSITSSLSKLKTDYADLLLVHWPNPDIPLAETIGALLDVKRQGLARAIGVSNFPSELLNKAQALAGGEIAVNQIEYHPFLNQDTLLNTCAELGVVVTAYCPIAKGCVNDNQVIRQIARHHGKTPVQVTLRWFMQKDQMIAIPKSRVAERLLSNIEIFDFALSRAEMNSINSLGRNGGRMIDPDWAPKWDAPHSESFPLDEKPFSTGTI
ncbi:MAG: aldo/keto reductase [Roseibium sp.]